jgi:hypothetical protein
MVSKHCQSCGRDGHPRQQHPSTFRTELTIWLVALVIGAVVGMWSAATSAREHPLSRAMPALTLSSVQAAPSEPAEPVGQSPRSDSSSHALVWLTQILVAFLEAAWWVLLLPIGFSIWRQWSSYPVCAACGSRRLAEVPTPHGTALPLD